MLFKDTFFPCLSQISEITQLNTESVLVSASPREEEPSLRRVPTHPNRCGSRAHSYFTLGKTEARRNLPNPESPAASAGLHNPAMNIQHTNSFLLGQKYGFHLHPSSAHLGQGLSQARCNSDIAVLPRVTPRRHGRTSPTLVMLGVF